MTITRFIFLAGAVASLSLGATVAASAADPTTPSASDNSYCALNVETGDITCAASQRDLGGTAAADGVITPQVSVLIARLYDNSNYNTAAGYLDVYSSADCTAAKTNIDYQNADLGSWRNRVSSFTSYGNCATKLWSTTSYGGSPYPSSGFLGSSTYVGATMNDNAESAQFS